MSYNSKIILCKGIKLDKDYVNVLSYSEQQMLSLCNNNSHKIAEASNYTFIDRNRKIRVAFTYSQCVQANYIAFQNPDYDNKWFFAFITNVEFKGNLNTEISFQIDSWSTWFDKWQKKPCYIIREHVNDDTIGANTIPENLDVGDVIEEDFEEIENLADDYYYIITSSYNPALPNNEFDGVNKLTGSIIGTNVFAFESSNVGVVSLRHFIQASNSAAKIESIKNLFILPKKLIDAIGTRSQSFNYQGATVDYYIVEKRNLDYDSADNGVEFPYSFNKVTSFSDYQPKNNKCFVWPYNYLLVSNNVGNYNIFKYENFRGNTADFVLQLSYAIGLSARLVPKFYKYISNNYEENLPLAKFPTCEWSGDGYTNWLTSNAVNVVTSIAGTVASIATGNIVTTAASIANLIGQFREGTLKPNIEGGNNTGDINFSMKTNTFYFHKMRVKTEYLKVIDDYFTRFRLSDK